MRNQMEKEQLAPPHGVRQSSVTNGLQCQTSPKATIDDQKLSAALSNLPIVLTQRNVEISD
jgi:hypothetical protein